MTKTATNGVIALVAIAVLVVGGYYLFGHKAPNSGDMAQKEGAVSQTDLSQATAALKSAVEVAGGAPYDFNVQPTYGHFANFGIVKNVNEVKSVGLVDETAIIFRGSTDNDYAEVEPKTNQVVSFHRSTDPNSTAPAKSEAEIEAAVRAFLAKIYPNFAQIESTLTFSPSMKGVRLNNSNYFYDWEDNNYQKQLPGGVEAERAPFIQVGITASGQIFSYNNTVDLYRNALAEFNLTQ